MSLLGTLFLSFSTDPSRVALTDFFTEKVLFDLSIHLRLCAGTGFFSNNRLIINELNPIPIKA